MLEHQLRRGTGSRALEKLVGAVLDLFDVTFEFHADATGAVEGMTAARGFRTSNGRKVGP